MSYWYIDSVRTTVRLNDAILKDAKKLALKRNISLTKLVEEALQEKLYRRAGSSHGRRVDLVTFKGHGLQPGVDLDDSAALLEVMED